MPVCTFAILWLGGLSGSLERAAIQALLNADYQQSEILGKACLATLLVNSSHDDRQARLLNNVGLAQARQYKFSEALASYSSAIALHHRRRPDDRDHTGYSKLLFNTASLYHEWGKYKYAEQYYKLLWDHLKRSGLADADAYVSLMTSLAFLYFDASKIGEAQKCVLAALDRVADSDDPVMCKATLFCLLTEIHLRMNHHALAKKALDDCIATKERFLEDAISNAHISYLLAVGSNKDAARLLAVQQRLRGKKKQSVSRQLYDAKNAPTHALVMFNEGEIDASKKLLQTSIDTQGRILGPLHPSVRRSLQTYVKLFPKESAFKAIRLMVIDFMQSNDELLGIRALDIQE